MILSNKYKHTKTFRIISNVNIMILFEIYKNS